MSPDPTPSRAIPRWTVAVVALGLVLGLVGAAFFFVPVRSSAADDPAQTRAVVGRVNDFAVAYNTYDVADLEDYQQRVQGLLTPRYYRDFDTVTTALFQAIADKKQKSGDANVKNVALESLDDDSATAMVVVDASVTNTDNAEAVLRQFRWLVELQKQDGQWNVDSFESVAAQPASGSEVTPTPSAGTPAPTATPSPTGGEGE